MLNIIFLGLVSFLQISAPRWSIYLTTTFGVTPALVGMIEGIAESTASLLIILSGYITDQF